MANADAIALERTGQQRVQAEHRLGELEATLAAHETTDPVNAALDWWNDLSAELRGVLQRGRLQVINEGVREPLASVTLLTQPDGTVMLVTHPITPVSLGAQARGEVEMP